MTERVRSGEVSGLAVLDALPLGILVLRKNGTVRYWNSELAEWTGVSREQIEDRQFAEFFDSLEQPRYRTRLQGVFESGAPQILSPQLHSQIVPCKPVGCRTRIQHTTITGIPGQEGGYDALFAIQDVTDLTHRVSTHREKRDRALEAKAVLEAQTKRLTEDQYELERFLHIATHDLQEPLRTLAAYSTFLEEDAGDDLPAVAVPHLTQIRRATARMQNMVRDVTTLSRARRAEQVPTPVDLNACFKMACDSLAKSIAETATEVRADELPMTLGVEALLEQVFQNLIENAIRFRRAGTHPKIDVACRRDGDAWEIAVRDNGIGIDPKFAEKVFEPFFRLDSRQEDESSGVGLAMCKQVVERYGGKIWSEAQKQPGATIRFRLPMLEEDAGGQQRKTA